MAHRQAKMKAFELFAKNFWPPEVASELKINIRTIQRWFIEWKNQSQGNVVDPENSIDNENTVIESESIIEHTPHLSTVKKVRGIADWCSDWEHLAVGLADELLFDHRKIRRRLTEILSNEIEKPELNTRVLQSLSQSIARHSEIEMAVANLSLFDVNKAFKVLEVHGYVVINPADANNQDKKLN